jgi:uncharacterized protein YaaQ
MKLVIAVIHDEDAHKLMEALTCKGFMGTKLASTGGFLKTGNTTILVGVPKEQVDTVIGVIKDKCKTEKQMTLMSPPIPSAIEGCMPYPVEVTVGGATVFVIDVEQYLKI